MLQDVFHPPEQLPIGDISSPLSDQIFDFCDPDLFSDTLQNSEVTSSPNCCYEDNSSYTPTDNNNNNNNTNSNSNNPTFPTELEKFNQDSNNNNNSTTTTATSTTTTATNATATTAANNNNLSIIFDSQDEIENDISASIDFSSSPTFSIPQFLSTQQYPFDFASSSSSMQPQPPNPNYPIQIPSPLTDQTVVLDGSVLSSLSQFPVDPVPPLLGPTGVTASAAATLPSVFEDDCLSSVPTYVAPNLNPSSPSCSFLGPGMATSYMPGTGTMTGVMPADGAGIFTGGILTGSSDLPPQELDFQGDNAGIFSCAPDSMQRVFNTGDLQKALSGDTQQLVGAVSSSAPITSEISSLDDSTFKVGKLSVEQRKEKIHRYMKKRNERNFSKKIKYACRKTLADSRPRVRGRFAKNDDFGEAHRTTCSNHEEDDDEEVVVKEEEDLVDSDIFAHISGVNSFKCNYPIQSWI